MKPESNAPSNPPCPDCGVYVCPPGCTGPQARRDDGFERCVCGHGSMHVDLRGACTAVGCHCDSFTRAGREVSYSDINAAITHIIVDAANSTRLRRPGHLWDMEARTLVLAINIYEDGHPGDAICLKPLLDAAREKVPLMPNQENRGWCSDCPDHEACATGWPCWKVRAIERLSRREDARYAAERPLFYDDDPRLS